MKNHTVSFGVILCGGTDPNIKSRGMVKGTAIVGTSSNSINHQIKVQGVQKNIEQSLTPTLKCFQEGCQSLCSGSSFNSQWFG